MPQDYLNGRFTFLEFRLIASGLQPFRRLLCSRVATYDLTRESVETTTLIGDKVGHVLGLQRGTLQGTAYCVIRETALLNHRQFLQWFKAKAFLAVRVVDGAEVNGVVEYETLDTFGAFIESISESRQVGEVATFDFTLTISEVLEAPPQCPIDYYITDEGNRWKIEPFATFEGVTTRVYKGLYRPELHPGLLLGEGDVIYIGKPPAGEILEIYFMSFRPATDQEAYCAERVLGAAPPIACPASWGFQGFANSIGYNIQNPTPGLEYVMIINNVVYTVAGLPYTGVFENLQPDTQYEITTSVRVVGEGDGISCGVFNVSTSGAIPANIIETTFVEDADTAGGCRVEGSLTGIIVEGTGAFVNVSGYTAGETITATVNATRGDSSFVQITDTNGTVNDEGVGTVTVSKTNATGNVSVVAYTFKTQ